MSWHDDYQVWLTETQSLQNAQLVVNHFYGNSDWSRESICALVGNMRHESSVNPDMYEYGYDWSADRGYGLVQWTPRSKYWNWATSNGKEPRSGYSQLDRIDYEVENNIQWIPRSDYGNMTFTQFRTNSGDWSIDYLTEAFTWGYERPNEQAGWNSMPDRKAFAHRANNELDWSGSGDPGNGDPGNGGAGKIRYIELQGDLLYIKFDSLSGKVSAYPVGAGRWVPRDYDAGPGGDPGNGGDPGTDVFVSPAQGTFTSGYGWRDYPPAPWHAGVDIANSLNTPVYSAVAGTVIGVGENLAPGRSGDRNVLIESPDNPQMGAQYYGHLESNNVSVGQQVNAGEQIGSMGERGLTTGVHLHFETWATTDPNSDFDPADVFNHYGVSIGSAPVIP